VSQFEKQEKLLEVVQGLFAATGKFLVFVEMKKTVGFFY
jgi:hypothetical protein